MALAKAALSTFGQMDSSRAGCPHHVAAEVGIDPH
jgi:hypothetical protein